MNIHLRNKILIVSLSVIMIELIFLLYRGDILSDFIPFVGSISSRHLRAYDFFFVIMVLVFRFIFVYHRINLAVIRNIPQLIGPMRPLDMGILIATGILTHYFAWPLIYGIFREPFSVIANTNALRRTAIMAMPLMWVWLVALLNKKMGISYTPQAQQVSNQALPSPPRW